MSDSQPKPWSNCPDAPRISYDQHFQEKADLSGILITPIFYGILIVLFFKCVGALLNPVHRTRQGIKWGLVTHTTVVFSFATVFTAMNVNNWSESCIDNREFPGVDGVLLPGPPGYQTLIYSKTSAVIPNLMFPLNNWMADGLLLHRCYAVYSINPWTIAFPCLMYLGSVGMGVSFIYRASQPNSGIWNSVATNFGLSYFSISIALNILLTLMIIIRLIRYSRSVRTAMGMTGIGGLCGAVVTMLVESFALCTVNALVFIGLWGARSDVNGMVLSILEETQVIAPLLIIQRVANKSASTSYSVVSGQNLFFEASNQGELTNSKGALPGGHPVGSADESGMNPNELGVGVETTVCSRRDTDKV